MSATFFKSGDILHKDDIIDGYLISCILKRANNPKKCEWSFSHGRYRIDILTKTHWKVEFFVSLEKAIQLFPKSFVLHSEKVSFH